MKTSKVVCGGCNKEFNIYTNKTKIKNWYIEKPLDNCKHHTWEKKRTSIHKKTTRRNNNAS